MKLRKIGCLMLAFLLAIPLAMPMKAHAASSFYDTRDHWAAPYINKAVSKGIIKGYSDGTFKPDNPVTRAEFTSMANRALGCNNTTTNTFTDVTSGDWFYPDIRKAVAAGYVAGYDQYTFKPNAPISREEAAVMIGRFVPTYGANGNLKRYPDHASVDSWASDALSKVNGKGYLGAYSDGLIHPRDQLTRAQTAKILCDILDKEKIVTSDPNVKTSGTKLSNTIYSNNVTISKDLGDNNASIENCVILGNLNVQGGGQNSVDVKNSRVANSSVNRTSGTVRLLASGETTIVNTTASNDSILQTSGLSGGTYGSGFSTVKLSGSSDTTLKGNFPTVSINGSSAELNLSTGNISTLTIESNGSNSDILIDSGATVSTVNVNAKSKFRGNGTISTMNVNADDVTYEKKPNRVNVGSKYKNPSENNFPISVSPSNGATKVKLNTNITLTFDTAMTKYNGSTIKNSDIDDFITLRKDSTSGKKISFDASINSSKKVITLEPNDDLEDDTKYYVIVDKNAMKYTNGKGNDSQTTYFNTGDDNSNLDIGIKPSHKAKNVKLNTDITLTFDTAMTKYNGSALKDSDVEDFVTLRKDSTSGKSLSFDASVSSNKRTITITPDRNLEDDTRYYVIIDKNALKDTHNKGNPGQTTYFSTGDDENDDVVTFYPRNGATNVSKSVSITLSFDESIEKYGGGSITDSYLEDVISFRRGGSTGSYVPFTASISSSKKITIKPDNTLDNNQKYYVGFSRQKFRTKSDKSTIGSYSATWTTTTDVATPQLSLGSPSSTENSVSFSVTPNVSGSLYSKIVPGSDPAPNAAKLKSETPQSVTANVAKTVSLSSLSPGTSYTFYGILRDGKGNDSSIVSKSITTKTPPASSGQLTKLSVSNGTLSPAFNPKVFQYTVTLPFEQNNTILSASADKDIRIYCVGGDRQTSAEGSINYAVSDADGKQITITTFKDGGNVSTYKIDLNVNGSADLDSIAIDGATEIDKNQVYSVPTETTTTSITITAKDPNATVSCKDQKDTHQLTLSLDLENDNTTISYTITPKKGSDKSYQFSIIKVTTANK